MIRRALLAAARAEGIGAATAVGVLVCDDETIRGYNRDYAGDDHATDVLSFAPGDPPVPGQEVELGDIILSLDRLREQAASAGHSLHQEAATLAIHGFLHLLGYDHAEPAGETEMFARTAEIVGGLGLAAR